MLTYILRRVLQIVPLLVIVSLALGIVSATRRNVDRALTIGTVAGISLPVFWFGLVLQLVFANSLGWLPSSGRASFMGGGFGDRVAHLVLPVMVLAAAHA